jgi:class 3 adenylate cyclase/tetratricopeptide (TPR) repeat protein
VAGGLWQGPGVNREVCIATIETVTVLFTDLVGSTQLESGVGPVRADELRAEHFAILRKAITAADGAREVKNTGDGVMVVFPSASGATECAVAMQQAFEIRNRGASEHLVIRVGVSMGDATHEGDDYFGMPVIEAARLCDKAPSAGILIPEQVRIMAGGRGNSDFKSVGGLDLKGIPDPVEAYEVAWEPVGAAEVTGLPLPGRLMGVPPLGYTGREQEIDLLDKHWNEARQGQRQVCLIAGEPGIGKTRLASHTAITRHGDGAVVLYGRCDEDLATPYGPWIEALAHYVEHAPEEVLEAHVEAHGGELTRLVPALGTRVPEVPEPRKTDPETERYLLFAAVTGLLQRASEETPAMILLDDLHWADKPTLALLKHVVGVGDSQSLLVLGTYRDSELSRQHPLTDTLADLRAEQGVERITLAGLGADDVVSMMEAAAGHEMDTRGKKLAAGIAGETNGNPFFIGEMLRHLTESEMLSQGDDGRWKLNGDLSDLGLPQSVREVVGRRIERLGESSRGALTAASVVGRDFDVDLLLGVTDFGEDELLDMLEAAVEASVLIEQVGRPGGFSFAHALINHTLYEDLSATRRARFHKRVAEALEQICGEETGPRVAELANHWTAASVSVDQAKALKYTRLAGQRALDGLAPDEALRWFTQARELASQQQDIDSAERCDILIGLGIAQRQCGEADYRETLLDASVIAKELGDGDRLAIAAIENNRGGFTGVGVIDHERISALESALELVAGEQLERRAKLMSLLAADLTFEAKLERRLQLGNDAEDLARESGDERTLAFVLIRRLSSIMAPETVGKRSKDLEEAAEIAERTGDPFVRGMSALFSCEVASELGDRDRLDLHLGKLEDLAGQLGEPLPVWFSAALVAMAAMTDGRIDDFERLAAEAAQIGTDSGQPDAFTNYMAQLLILRWMQERSGEMLGAVEQAVEQNPDISIYRPILAALYCDVGRAEEGGAILEKAFEEGFASVPRDFLWLATMNRWAEVAAETEAEDAAEALYELLEPWADQFPCTLSTVRSPIRLNLGMLATTLGRHEEADAHFERALELCENFRSPLFTEVCRLAWGRALLERGTAEEAERGRELVAEALAAGRELDIPRIKVRAEALLASSAAST